MYTPHTVTIFNVEEDLDTLSLVSYATILKGVFLDISEGQNIQKSGLESSNKAVLYIPFNAKAVDAITGAERSYLEPRKYRDADDKELFWTLEKSSSDSSTPCFFVKGEVYEVGEYATIKKRYDYVYDVKTIDVRDFGSVDMQHWEVGGV